jgi:hypothetical protein
MISQARALRVCLSQRSQSNQLARLPQLMAIGSPPPNCWVPKGWQFLHRLARDVSSVTLDTSDAGMVNEAEAFQVVGRDRTPSILAIPKRHSAEHHDSSLRRTSRRFPEADTGTASFTMK